MNIANEIVHNEKVILSFVHILFIDARYFFKGTCAKEELINEYSLRSRLRKLPVLLESIRNSIPIRRNITSNFY